MRENQTPPDPVLVTRRIRPPAPTRTTGAMPAPPSDGMLSIQVMSSVPFVIASDGRTVSALPFFLLKPT